MKKFEVTMTCLFVRPRIATIYVYADNETEAIAKVDGQWNYESLDQADFGEGEATDIDVHNICEVETHGYDVGK
jgi:hypothetical protein